MVCLIFKYNFRLLLIKMYIHLSSFSSWLAALICLEELCESPDAGYSFSKGDFQ
jgi:hypothetical protein